MAGGIIFRATATSPSPSTAACALSVVLSISSPPAGKCPGAFSCPARIIGSFQRASSSAGSPASSGLLLFREIRFHLSLLLPRRAGSRRGLSSFPVDSPPHWRADCLLEYARPSAPQRVSLRYRLSGSPALSFFVVWECNGFTAIPESTTAAFSQTLVHVSARCYGAFLRQLFCCSHEGDFAPQPGMLLYRHHYKDRDIFQRHNTGIADGKAPDLACNDFS